MEILSLKEALHRYCSRPLQLSERIHSIFTGALKDSLHYAGTDISLLVAESYSVRNILTQGFRLCGPKTKLTAPDLSRKLEDAKDTIYCNKHIASLLDCLNQMGNVTFLRKRKEWKRQSNGEAAIQELKNIYAEYFTSVRHALNEIQKSLKKIKKNLDLS